VWAMQSGRKNERMIDACTNELEVEEYLVKAKSSVVPVTPLDLLARRGQVASLRTYGT